MNLANPKMMDVAVPANPKIGLLQGELEARGWSLNIVEGKAALGDDDMSLIDLRNRGRTGAPWGDCCGWSCGLYRPRQKSKVRWVIAGMVAANGKDFVFYCVFGERSAMAALTRGIKKTVRWEF
jgi:sulfur dioxygenase